jgi:predicted TIM-barrel fold metal-dependent hydrolase
VVLGLSTSGRRGGPIATADVAFVVDADSHWYERTDLFTSRGRLAAPDVLASVEEKLAKVSPATRRKILGENARKLCRV